MKLGHNEKIIKVVLLTKIQNDSSKIVDFLKRSQFLFCLSFFELVSNLWTTPNIKIVFSFKSPTTTPTPSCGKKVVCYYPNWAYWRAGSGKFKVDNIDPKICTHLIYAFVALNPATHTIKIFDQHLDITLKNYEKFVALKQQNPNLKVKLSNIEKFQNFFHNIQLLSSVRHWN